MQLRVSYEDHGGSVQTVYTVSVTVEEVEGLLIQRVLHPVEDRPGVRGQAEYGAEVLLRLED